MGWVVRLLLIAADLVASWFVARDAVNFPIISLVAGIFLFVLLVILLAFWPAIVRLFRDWTGTGKSERKS